MRRSIVNDPDDLVAEALEGLVLTHPTLLELNAEHRYVTRKQKARDKVGLVSGGGAGHEPLHSGFVGTGMLDVAVSGAVFASPTALQVLAATKAADAGRGVVQIVKNYTGDVLNFRIAGEISGDDAIDTEIVLVDDDLASDTGEDDGPGRRGTAATVIVEKICGAAAEEGRSLKEVAEIGRRVAARSRTLSLALAAGTHPGDDEPQFTLEADEVEFGVGIHGERAKERVPFTRADDLTEQLVDPLVKELELDRGDDVLAIVNGLGSAYPLELSVVARALHHRLADGGIHLSRSLVGSYVTSLDMHGVSLTLMPLDDETSRLWDAPVRTPALTW
ncbi:dihydroxyacetone kinase subunit DhaK [Brachybacterium muris]|uniref:dihydroxyacetone kinase subunit DhaK n=1 Tax=Brachybacterium muris TaxID=219301 RepID=UPI000DB0C9C9|nr:dihydroxyacetone kinase subunit DhaK [Brachybacterium muris]MCT2260235.1 dihydroxyacetone kinase subunit DhaK [Brachybacterium muris]PZP14738.1 MAG: dihydroxyacetone kinase subunit DhaK [Brachybacterium faecium]